jgi:hypothetical protein
MFASLPGTVNTCYTVLLSLFRTPGGEAAAVKVDQGACGGAWIPGVQDS